MTIKFYTKFFFIYLILLAVSSSYSQEITTNNTSNSLSKTAGMQISYWYEPSFKSGLVLAIDWEFLNNKGHGFAITFPALRMFVFPYNSFSLSLYTALSYRYIDPKNGFYTSLGLGLGMDAQWLIIPLYNTDGNQIKDLGLVRLFTLAQWDIGYDFMKKFNKPIRLFTSFGWNGRSPTNLGINNHLFFQIGINVIISDLSRS